MTSQNYPEQSSNMHLKAPEQPGHVTCNAETGFPTQAYPSYEPPQPVKPPRAKGSYLGLIPLVIAGIMIFVLPITVYFVHAKIVGQGMISTLFMLLAALTAIMQIVLFILNVAFSRFWKPVGVGLLTTVFSFGYYVLISIFGMFIADGGWDSGEEVQGILAQNGLMPERAEFYLGTGMLLVAWICYGLAFAFALIEPIRARQRAAATQNAV